jgi:DnaJ-class molecular chaperone
MDKVLVECCSCGGKGKKIKFASLLVKQKLGFFAHQKIKCWECNGEGRIKKQFNRVK